MAKPKNPKSTKKRKILQPIIIQTDNKPIAKIVFTSTFKNIFIRTTLVLGRGFYNAYRQ